MHVLFTIGTEDNKQVENQAIGEGLPAIEKKKTYKKFEEINHLVYFAFEIPNGILMMKKSERTRQYIIEQTAPIFSKKGYAGTSMSDLTEATGLTKGAIYGNFENKDEVALAALAYNIEQITSTIGKKMESRATPWEKLMVFPEFYRSAFIKGFLKIGCPIANTAPEADDTHPALRNMINETIALWDKGVQRLVKQGVETGEIKADTDPSAIASLMISLIEGGLMITKSTGNTKYFTQSLGQVEKLLNEIKK